MEALKSPTMNIFSLLDEEERKKQFERSTEETTTQPTRTTIPRTDIRQQTSGQKPTSAKDSYPTTSTRPEQVVGGNGIYIVFDM